MMDADKDKTSATEAGVSKGIWDEAKRGTPGWFKQLREKYPDHSRDKIINLHTGHRFALAEWYLFDRKNAEICEKYGFTPHKWTKIKRSDEAKEIKKWLESLEMPDILKNLWETESFHVSIDLKMLYEWACENRDYKTAHKIAMDMIGLGQIPTEPQKKVESAIPSTINVTLQLGGANVDTFLDSPTYEADYEVVSEDDGEKPAKLPKG